MDENLLSLIVRGMPSGPTRGEGVVEARAGKKHGTELWRPLYREFDVSRSKGNAA